MDKNYKDYVDKMPDDVISKLNAEYGNKVIKMEIKDDSINKYLCEVYSLITKSSAYFNSYNNVRVNNIIDKNIIHKNIIKSMHCCEDYSIYDGYLVPRYLNMNRCYHDHYCCEIDIIKILLLLLGLKEVENREMLCKMATERIDVLNSLVLESK